MINKYGSVVVESSGKIGYGKSFQIFVFQENGELRIKQGGLFCNEGAKIKGIANIIYEGGSIHHIMCSSLADYVMSDSKDNTRLECNS